MSTRAGRSGFTLVELLVVVVIIAIISGSVVALLGGLTTQSAVAMTFATEKQLTNEFNIFQKTHSGLMPDSYDSMLRNDWKTIGKDAFTTDATTGQIMLTAAADTASYMYSGYNSNATTFAYNPTSNSKGMTILLMGSGVQTLSIAKLRQSDLTALNSMGINYVYDIDPTQDATDQSKLTRVRRTLAVGDPVMALIPKAFGTMPTYVTISGNSNADAAGNPIVKDLFLVFGIGPKTTIIGNRLGGLQETPACPTIVTNTNDKPRPRNDFYNNYMVVIKMPYDGFDKPSFAGILDCQGWNVQGGLQWYNRFPE